MKPATAYLSNLTPLRGFAALVVVMFHFEELIGRFVNAHDSMFIRKGYLMVDLFFVMSGFIIFHVYGSNFQNKINLQSVGKFLVARFARIYPLHFIMLVFCILLMFVAGNDPAIRQVFNPAAIPTHIFLLHSFGIHSIYTFNVPSWSISAEWWSYMIFPVIVLCLSKNKRLTIISSIVFIIAAYVAIMYFLPRRNPLDPSIPMPHNLDSTYDYGFLRGLAGFISGVLLYILYQSYRVKNIFKTDVICMIGFLAVAAGMHFGINDGLQIPLFAFLILATACNNGFVTKICNNRVLQYLGEISYSIYMTQLIVLYLVPQIVLAAGITLPHAAANTFSFFAGALYCLVIVVSCIAISSFFYHKIEMPCRKWINQKWVKRTYVLPVVVDSLVDNKESRL